jgi:CelD/BcsL family acetyltransferase involved in cellulose biosynthesis
MALTIAELSSFDPLRPEWDELLGHSAGGQSIFSTWDWQRLWWQTFGGAATLRILTARDEGSLIGIWPLMQEGETLALVGGVEVCDYLDVIAIAGRERAVLEAGLHHLDQQGATALDLRFLPAASPTLQHLPALAEAFGWVVAQEVDDVCPTVDLSDSWESYLASLGKKDRHELRRKLRRLTEAGQPEFEVLTGDGGIEQDSADFVRLHRLSRTEKAAFMDEMMEEFFRSIIASFRPRGLLKTYFLALDGRRVATTLCVEHDDGLWVYNSGFDRDYAAFSVGLALKAFCVEDAIRQGKRKVDFLRGREPYKYDLGARDVPVYRLKLNKA